MATTEEKLPALTEFTLTATISLGNDAMQTEENIIEAIRGYLYAVNKDGFFTNKASIRDRNGNTVGTVVTEYK